jgi:hypothetical protein
VAKKKNLCDLSVVDSFAACPVQSRVFLHAARKHPKKFLATTGIKIHKNNWMKKAKCQS